MKKELEKKGEYFLRDFLLLKGCIVHLIENKIGTGRGCPDMLIIKDGCVFLYEVKQEATIKDLRVSQHKTLLAFNGCSVAHCQNGKVLEYYPSTDTSIYYINAEEWYLSIKLF